MNFQEYIRVLNQRFQSGQTTEHSFRGDLQQLLESILNGVRVINEPKRGRAGAPDYILMHPKEDLALGYIEAKDIGKDISSKTYTEQFDRYKAGLNNLIITDYLTFEFYYEGKIYETVTLGTILSGKIHPTSNDNYQKFELLVRSFINKSVQTINNSEVLAKIMANKAKLLANEIYSATNDDLEFDKNTDLTAMLNSFREFLIHDLDSKSFSDIYAQTIVYGMFAARYNDPSLETFNRYEAASLIPHNNPFLRKLFGVIAGIDLDPRIAWIVDDLVVVFRYTNVKKIMKNYGKSTYMNDPIIHFYETFLAEYDPALRKSRGVWYTPEPVVKFIVHSVDIILKDKFKILEGLSDSQKQMYEFDTHKQDKRTKSGVAKEKREFHRVQILDPATGTGTFLNEVINLISRNFKGMEGLWSQYVENDLIPRLNGFELLMASYTMAHLKLDMRLSETGFKSQDISKRLNIYLTNSLEEHDKDFGTIFSSWLSEESREASRIKKDAPVMVVLGNPPYSVSSSNNSPWINSLMDLYKKDLNEKNIQPLSDDYIKFIRYGQHFIEKNNEGIIAYITSNSFLNGSIHRQMRKSLLETFDEIYILNLHGNSRIKETSPDGSPDHNVFDIMTGVSINIFIKKNNASKKLGDVFYYDLFGKRNDKYDFLLENDFKSVQWEKINYRDPDFYFVPKTYKNIEEYEKGFYINELMPINSSGVQTEKDNINYFVTFNESEDLKRDFITLSEQEVIGKYSLKPTDVQKIKNAIKDLKTNEVLTNTISYRPFDMRYTNYTGVQGIMGRPRLKVMRHMLHDNTGLLVTSKNRQLSSQYHFITTSIVDRHFLDSSADSMNLFPLYLYETSSLVDIKRVPNFNKEIISTFCQVMSARFVNEESEIESDRDVAPIHVLDYIYAILHSPSYQKSYQEFLKTNFPKIPYPEDIQSFKHYSSLGKMLRETHLLTDNDLSVSEVTYPKNGSNIISNKIVSKDFEVLGSHNGRIWINKEQFFDSMPIDVWNFYIGGYQPAQKWLKDRCGLQLTHHNIKEYFQIINAITKTIKIIQLIDK